jgi:oligopeptidase A
LITDFWLEYGQSEKLYEGFEHLQQNAVGRTGAETKLIDEALKDLRLAGVALNPERRRRFRELTQQLTAKQAKFEQNLMDATDAFRLHETRSEALTGLPAQLLERARQAAKKDGLDGWLLFLDPPTYTTVMAQAEAEALRRSYYEAWVTRASDQGPHAGRWDNAALIEDILALRHESAQLLGFSSFAQLSLATKMAVSPVQVLGFLQDLAAKSRGVAETELVELEAHAGLLGKTQARALRALRGGAATLFPFAAGPGRLVPSRRAVIQSPHRATRNARTVASDRRLLRDS